MALTVDPWTGFPLHTTSIVGEDTIKSPGTITSVQNVSEQAISNQETLQSDTSSSQNPIAPLLNGIDLRNHGKYEDAKNFFVSFLSSIRIIKQHM